VEEFDRQSNFITDSSPWFAQLITVQDAGRCGLGRSLVHGDYNNVAPRVGLA